MYVCVKMYTCTCRMSAIRERAFDQSDFVRARVIASTAKDVPYPSSPLKNANSDATSKQCKSFRRERIFAALSKYPNLT